MSYTSGLTARQAANEHVLAVSRDFISQPRLSEYFYFLLLIYHWVWTDEICYDLINMKVILLINVPIILNL